MDCQFIMGFFAYIYYHSFIAQNKVALGDVLGLAIRGLSVDEQVELVSRMVRFLENQGAWGPEVSPPPSSVYPLSFFRHYE